ncbi:flagellar hook-length control protein FliK [Xenorhabdus cabanillasii]|uniref:Flagellar hook-length control protein FliK n=1 Tax=Xenorhabdus cabanillasii TaxID=351673 RepID=A0A3D9UKT7_9GAMM|nr:flagellar hook-length control protein FliK [Xenorhabdus cabanillasii]REF28540.1 flagellar hook-length control protein FliK [Xenorhabdus cabanillasii]
MNLTLLPTDLTSTEKMAGKSQQTLSDSNESKDKTPEFGLFLNAETDTLQKASVQTRSAQSNSAKTNSVQSNKVRGNSENGEKRSTDNKIEGELTPSLVVVGQTTIQDKFSALPSTSASTSASISASTSDNDAELTLLDDEDPLSAETLINTMPVQLAGLISRQSTGDSSENPDDLSDIDNNIDGTLAGKTARGDIVLATTEPAEHTEDKGLDDDIRSFIRQDAASINNGQTSAKNRSVLASTSEKVKSTANNTDPNSIPLTSGKENSGKKFAFIQGASTLATASTETFSSGALHTLFASPHISAGHQTNGQFQLNGTPAPLLSAHPGSEEWQQQLNQHVLFFNRNGLQQAELRLHPQELGALHIRMNVEDNQAQLHFVSAHQHVRAALEAALPNLRHALAENGIQLAQSSVSSDTSGNWQQEQPADPQQQANTRTHAESNGTLAATQAPTTHESTIRITPRQLASSRGGVDIFA